MVLTFQDEKSLQDALNLWEDYSPKVVKKGALYSIVNLPDLGEQLILNPNFEDGETNWALGDGWSVSNSQAHCDGTQTGSSNIFQTSVVEDNKTYLVEMYLKTIEGGEVAGNCGGNSATKPFIIAGINKDIITEDGGLNAFYMTASADFIGSIDHAFCYEILE